MSFSGSTLTTPNPGLAGPAHPALRRLSDGTTAARLAGNHHRQLPGRRRQAAADTRPDPPRLSRRDARRGDVAGRARHAGPSLPAPGQGAGRPRAAAVDFRPPVLDRPWPRAAARPLPIALHRRGRTLQLVDQIRRAQDVLQRRFVVENVSSYIEFNHSAASEGSS